MCNLYSITTNQAAIIALFRVINRYVGKAAKTLTRSRSAGAAATSPPRDVFQMTPARL
jgi:hypothetical protein